MRNQVAHRQMSKRGRFWLGPCIPTTVIGALFGCLISPLTDCFDTVATVLLTPPLWAILGFLVGALLEFRTWTRAIEVADSDVPNQTTEN